MAQLHYLPDDRTVEIAATETILQASRRAGIPHTQVCGGNARCSTCRVRILDGLEHCGERNAREQALAARLQFDPSIRLACQTTVRGNVQLRRLVLSADDIAVTSQLEREHSPGVVGHEQRLTILFADIRGFTSFAEQQLPYDVIHALNRYFHAMGQVISRHGGYIDNYMGDGLMALFGVEMPEDAAVRAVRAGLEMLETVERLNPQIESLYGRRLRIGIGIHTGEVVVGAVGAAGQQRVTAIGDAVNVASRIEDATKATGTSLLISEVTYAEARAQFKVRRCFRLALPGKQGEYDLYDVAAVHDNRIAAQTKIEPRAEN